jgi:Flp pilus assembly protein TadG
MMGHRENREHERGAILVHVAFAIIALMAFSTFVIDYGVFWLSRRQAQNAADAGALAGAIALAYDDYTDRYTTGPAQQSAQMVALANQVFGAAPSVQLGSDITFPPCPDDGTNACVRVNVYRTLARRNPLPVFAGTFVGLTDQDVQATATAKVANGNATDCLRPFAVPDIPYTLEEHLGETVEFRDEPGTSTGPGWFRLLDLIGGGQGGTTEVCRPGHSSGSRQLRAHAQL